MDYNQIIWLHQLECNTVLFILYGTSWHSVQFDFDNFVVCKLVISICEWQAIKIKSLTKL